MCLKASLNFNYDKMDEMMTFVMTSNWLVAIVGHSPIFLFVIRTASNNRSIFYVVIDYVRSIFIGWVANNGS